MEIYRRAVLLLGIVSAIWLAMYASLLPVVTVRTVDWAAMQQRERNYTEQGQYLSRLPLDEYIEENIRGRSQVVSGEEWQKFFTRVDQAAQGSATEPDWSHRISPDERKWDHTPYTLFFRPWEEPLASLADRLTADPGEPFYLVLEENGERQYLGLSYHDFADEEFQFGTGLSFSPRPPNAFLYPYRKYALPVLLAGLAGYVLLPWRRRASDSIYYAYWRVVLGDVAALLLVVPFFGGPFLIVGGSVQVLTQGWFFPLFLWPFALAGVWLLAYLADCAAYEIRILDDGLWLRTSRRESVFPFHSMEYWEPIELRTPRWMIALLWLAALAGKGGQSYQAAGQAMLLENSSYRGLSIALRNGSAVYFWITSQMGAQAMVGAERLVNALRAAGVEMHDQVKVVESILMPEGEGAAVSGATRIRNWSLFVMLVFPLVAIVGLAVAFYVADMSRSFQRAFLDDGSESASNKPVEPGEWIGGPVAWEKTFSVNTVTTGTCMTATPGGGWLIGGVTREPGSSRQDALAIAVDSSGTAMWQNGYGNDQVERTAAVRTTTDGGFLLLGLSGFMESIRGGSQMSIRKLDAEGQSVWSRLWGEGKLFPWACDARPADDATLTVLGYSDRAVYRLQLDAQGEVVAEQTVPLDEAIGEGQLRWVAFTDDGGCVAIGETINEGADFKDLLLLRLDAEGNLLWRKTFGGRRTQVGTFVRPLPDGRLIATGFSAPSDEDRDAFAVLVDADGNPIGETACGGPGEQSIEQAVPLADGRLLLVGTSRENYEVPSRIYLVLLTADGSLIEQKHLGRANASYSGWAAAPTPDGGCVILGDRSLQEYHEETVLLRLEKESLEVAAP